MAGSDPHAPAACAVVAEPTLSLLRWSAGQRLLGAAAVLAVLWVFILLTIA
jgi:hypothetical protein